MSEREPSRAFVTLAIMADAAAIVVIGGGVVGSRKILSLTGQGARVRVVAPEIAGRIRPLLADGRIEWVRECYRPEHLNGARVVVAATSDADLNAAIARDARQRGLLVCNASSAEDSDVLFPAIHKHDGATIAVHTGGAKPRYAKQLRDEVAALLIEPSRPSRASQGRWACADGSPIDGQPEAAEAGK